PPPSGWPDPMARSAASGPSAAPHIASTRYAAIAAPPATPASAESSSGSARIPRQVSPSHARGRVPTPLSEQVARQRLQPGTYSAIDSTGVAHTRVLACREAEGNLLPR